MGQVGPQCNDVQTGVVVGAIEAQHTGVDVQLLAIGFVAAALGAHLSTQAWQAPRAGVAEQFHLTGKAGDKALALQLKVLPQVEHDAHIGHTQPGTGRCIGVGWGAQGAQVQLAHAGAKHHHIVAQAGGAALGEDEQGLVSLEAAAQLQLALRHARRHIARYAQSPIGPVAHAQVFGFDLQSQIGGAQRIALRVGGGLRVELDPATGLELAPLCASPAQVQALQHQALALQARLHLPLAELNALHGRSDRQLVGLQAALPLGLAAGAAQAEAGVECALHAPARRGQHRPSPDLRQAGLHAAAQGGLLGPLPALRGSTQLAFQLGLCLAHLCGVPVQLGHQLLVLHPHKHLGLAQTSGRGLAGGAVGLDAQIALAALSRHAQVQVPVHAPLGLTLQGDLVQEVGAQPGLRPGGRQV